MKNYIKSLAMSLAAICVLLIMAVPAFAVSGTGYYSVGTAISYNNPISVKVIVQSRCNVGGSSYINVNQTVTLGQSGVSGQTFSVRDAIIGFNSAQSAVEAYNISGNPISSSDHYIYGFSYNSNNYEPLFKSNHGETTDILCDGWMFRVNGKIPISSTMSDPSAGNYYGTDISQTPIADGDIIYFYWDYPWKESGTLMSSYFTSADVSYSGTTLTVNLKASYDWFADKSSNYAWTISNFSTYKPANNTMAYIYDSSNNQVGSVTISKSTGSGSKTLALSSGTYYVSVPGMRVTKTISGVDVNGNSVSCTCLKSTPAYDKFTI